MPEPRRSHARANARANAETTRRAPGAEPPNAKMAHTPGLTSRRFVPVLQEARPASIFLKHSLFSRFAPILQEVWACLPGSLGLPSRRFAGVGSSDDVFLVNWPICYVIRRPSLLSTVRRPHVLLSVAGPTTHSVYYATYYPPTPHAI